MTTPLPPPPLKTKQNKTNKQTKKGVGVKEKKRQNKTKPYFETSQDSLWHTTVMKKILPEQH